MIYMSYGAKKDSSVLVRLPEELQASAKKVSDKSGIPLAALIRLLLEQYVKAASTHGSNMPWPPQFQYYDTEPIHDPREAQKGKGEPRNAETRLVLPVAAEGSGRYSTTPAKAGCSKQE